MKANWMALGLILITGDVWSAPGTLDALLDSVRKERIVERRDDREREERFVKARDRQRELFEQAHAMVAKEEVRAERLKQEYAKITAEVDALRAQRDEMTNTLGDIQTVFGNLSNDTLSTLSNSLVSIDHIERLTEAKRLAALDELPTLEDLNVLWELMLQVAIESGKVTRFPANVVTDEGDHQSRTVVRLGDFSLLSEGQYLRYVPENKKLIVVGGQPPQNFQRMASAFQQVKSGSANVAVDPTRGALLTVFAQKPDWKARIQQGGIIGYVIIGLGGIGLLIALERLLALTVVGVRVKRQTRSEYPHSGNPLGRLIQVASESTRENPETLSLKLDDSILREIPSLQRGLGSLSVLAAVAPLLGLLGTVIGIIETFQSITLFGAGDPRLMSGGISLALVTTVMGLVAAIPLLLLQSFLLGKSNRIIQILDESSAAAIAEAAERGHVA